MLYQKFWELGNIVKLRLPYHPSDPLQALRDAVVGKKSSSVYHDWQGFTHGIIVQIIGHDHNGVSNVSLHLYDPLLCVFYVEEGCQGIPTYVDFHVDELIPFKVASETGYTPIGGR